MKLKRIGFKKGLLVLLVVLILGLSVIAIPYFIPSSPKFAIRKYFNATDNLELNKCSIHDYKDMLDGDKYKQYLLFSKKINLSQEELEEELYLVKKLDEEKFAFLNREDIVKYKVTIYVDSTLAPTPLDTVTLIRNTFDESKYKWLVVP